MNEKLDLIDLNQADVAALTTLPGLGPKLAARIVAYREQNGPFEYPADITAVLGISSELFLRFADQVTVSAPVVEEEVQAEPVAVVEPPEEPVTQTKPDKVTGAEQLAEEAPPPAEEEPAVEEEEGYMIMWEDEESEAAAAQPETALVAKGEAAPVVATPPVKPAGQSIWRLWVLMMIALFGGAVLALLVMQVLNGTLIFGRHPQIVALNRQVNALEQENKLLTQQVEELQATINQYADLSQEMQTNRADILLLKQARDKLENQTETLAGRADILEGNVISLAEESVKMQKIITRLENDAGRFNSFLTGLRTLLISVEGETDTDSILTREATPTPAIATTPTPQE
ncbi:MAG: helix-hairpin-helix domain-containing protein [Anaerolineae bacterium]|nr:helix-hairpin-helix domain-containing protein [Anaerolineae bacterium]